MLSSKILKNDIKYNDDLKYVDGDDIFKPTIDKSHKSSYHDKISYINYVVDNLGENNNYKLITKSFEKNYHVDLKPITSLVTHKIIKMNFVSLCDFNVRIIDNNDVLDVKDDRYDSINYYGTSDILEVPKIIYDKLKEGNELEINMALYNMDKCIKHHDMFKNDKKINRPNLILEYIPKKINYSFLDKEFNGVIKSELKEYDDFYYQYRNLSREEYNKIMLDCQTLAYDVDEKFFYGHSNSNQTKINVLCKDIANDGLKKVIQLRLFDNGKMVSYFSNKRLLIAKYLDLPMIPCCIIYNNSLSKYNLDDLYMFYYGL